MEKMKIEIWSDVMCPFCYIGKRRFEKALDQFPQSDSIEVVWKSFQLNPDMITNPKISTTEALAKSKGWTLEHTREMSAYVSEMAKEEGLLFDFDNAVVANSFKAHRVLQYAKTLGKGDALKELLLKAYFIEGKNTDDNTVLIRLGETIGLDSQAITEVVNNKEAFADAVNLDVDESRKLGITGVPFFVFDRKLGVSGAQKVEAFGNALQKAFEAWSGNKVTPNIVGMAD